MSVPIPIVCQRRTNFVIHAPDVPALQMPALDDPSGVFCRPDNVGFNFICGKYPTKVSFPVVLYDLRKIDSDLFQLSVQF